MSTVQLNAEIRSLEALLELMPSRTVSDLLARKYAELNAQLKSTSDYTAAWRARRRG